MDHASCTQEVEAINNLDYLLQSCASIKETSLSFRTLSSHADPFVDAMAVVDGGGDEEEEEEEHNLHDNKEDENLKLLLRREQLISEWLERQILEKEARLLKPPPLSSSATSTTTSAAAAAAASGSTRNFLVHHLVDSAERLELERCLLTRMTRSKQAHDAIFGATSTRNSSNASDQQQQKQQLLNALKSRDNQVAENLIKSRQLEALRKQVRCAAEDCRSLKRENQKRWEQLKRKDDISQHYSNGKRAEDVTNVNGGASRRNGNRNHYSSRKTSDSTKESNTAGIPSSSELLRDENVVLRRVILDLLAMSGLDWYHDARLHDIMMRLTSQQDNDDD